MSVDDIAEIGITPDGGLYVKPKREIFPFIYREAMEVHWNKEGAFLYGPKPRKWTLVEWFAQILFAANQQGCELQITDQTEWCGMPDETRKQIEATALRA